MVNLADASNLAWMRANRNLMESSQNAASGAQEAKTLNFFSAGTGGESAARRALLRLPESTGDGRRALVPAEPKLVAMAT